ncbi:MAG: hypothetical protein IKK60_01065 [Clostridia bacterium]|nr:hypothetical protein [Clostridia bacterium]
MKKLSRIFLIVSLILSHIMCVCTAYNYRGYLCGIEHQGFSAPAGTALLTAVPFIIVIGLCLALAYIFRRRIK